MENFFETHRNSLIAVAVALVAMLSSIVVVPETEEAVIIQAGRPDRVANRFVPDQAYGETGAGIILRIPFYERVQRVDKRVLNVDMEPQTVLSTDQLRLNVDAYARYRIIDPVLMVETAGTLTTVDSQLAAVLSSVVRQELGRRSFSSLLTAERGTTMANIRAKLDDQARRYGAQVIDVRIKRADLPDGTPLESAFTRMRTARQQEALTIRAQGLKQAQIIRAEADANAARIYAESFGKDANFYDFYRAMQAYRYTFAPDRAGGTTMVLSKDNEFLKQFQGR